MLSSLINPFNLEAMTYLASTAPAGCFVEIGVYKGGSAFHLCRLAEEQRREIFLYDTFTGIPCKSSIDSHEVGDFGDTSFDEVQSKLPYATVVRGVFPTSVVAMPPVAFAHVDVDQYESTKQACEALATRMAKGGIILFDDVWCLEGATLALQETCWVVERTEFGKAFVRF